MEKKSQLITTMIEILYPFIMLFGLYIILNGHNTPGGGFQGGAIFSAVFIGRYLVFDSFNKKIDLMQIAEKIVYIIIVLVALTAMFLPLKNIMSDYNEIYLIVLNSLIGIKVFLGLSIIFIRFAFYENIS